MGIKGLHQQLETSLTRLEVLRGKCLAVDGHGWLHRAACGCAEDVVKGTTERYAEFVVDQVKALARAGVRCVLVFDGDAAPIKSGTAVERKRKRDEARREAEKLEEQLLRATDDDVVEHFKVQKERCYGRAVEITKKMVDITVRRVRREVRAATTFRDDAAKLVADCKCLVAPYESDAQLAALCVTGFCDGVLSEDSDVVVYLAAAKAGASVVSKYSGDICETLAFDGLRAIAKGPFDKLRQFIGKTTSRGSITVTPERMFVQSCVLAGCDYVGNAKGVGIVTAAKGVTDAWSIDDGQRLSKVAKRLCAAKKITKVVATVLAEKAVDAEIAFYNAHVFNDIDLRKASCVPFCSLFPGHHPAASEETRIRLLGPRVEPANRIVPSNDVPAYFRRHKPTIRHDSSPPKQPKVVTQSPPLVIDENRRPTGVDPDHVCLETLDELPPDLRADIQRQMHLARRSIRDLNPNVTVSSTKTTEKTTTKSQTRTVKRTAAGTRKTTTSAKTTTTTTSAATTKTLFHYFVPKTKRPRKEQVPHDVITIDDDDDD